MFIIWPSTFISLSTFSWPVNSFIAFFLLSIHCWGVLLSGVEIKPPFNPLSSISTLETPFFRSNPCLFWKSRAILFAIIRLLSLSHSINIFGIISIASLNSLSDFSPSFIWVMFDQSDKVLPSSSLVSVNNNVFPSVKLTSLVSLSVNFFHLFLCVFLSSSFVTPSSKTIRLFWCIWSLRDSLIVPSNKLKFLSDKNFLALILEEIKVCSESQNIMPFGILSIPFRSLFIETSLFLISVISDHNEIVLPSSSLVSVKRK